MRRAAPPPLPVSPALLRHFAVVTVVITAGLAMFASGENREIVVEQIKAQQQKNHAKQVEREKGGNRRVVVEGMRTAPGVSYDAPEEYRDPPGGGGGGGSSDSGWSDAGVGPVAPPPRELASPAPFEAKDPNGMPIGGRAPQSPSASGAKRPGVAARPRPPTQAQIDAMLAASRARAGGDSSNYSSDDSGDE